MVCRSTGAGWVDAKTTEGGRSAVQSSSEDKGA